MARGLHNPGDDPVAGQTCPVFRATEVGSDRKLSNVSRTIAKLEESTINQQWRLQGVRPNFLICSLQTLINASSQQRTTIYERLERARYEIRGTVV